MNKRPPTWEQTEGAAWGQAFAAVGTTDAQRFQWLITLPERPTDTEVDRERLAREIDAFVSVRQDEALAAGDATGNPFALGRTLESEVPGIVAQTRRWLDELRDTRSTSFDVAPRQRLIYHSGTTTAASWSFVLLDGTARQHFNTHVLALLRALGPRLRVCELEGCRRWFLVARPAQQKFCSRRCTNRAMFERYKERHPERVQERRRRRYEQTVRSRLQKQKLKISRRPRQSKKES